MLQNKKIKIAVALILLWFSFVFCEQLFWGWMSFIYPDMWTQLEAEYRHIPSDQLIKKLYSFNFLFAERAQNILAERKEKKAGPYILRFLKSPRRYKRHSAMYALAKMGDKRAIEPLKKLIRKGRNHPDYLLAMDTLASLHYEGIYPDILQMAKDNFHTSWVVSMLENFPNKPETIPTLKKIAETDAEEYIREKAKNAIKHIESLQK